MRPKSIDLAQMARNGPGKKEGSAFLNALYSQQSNMKGVP